jgi:hypothetical protein
MDDRAVTAKQLVDLARRHIEHQQTALFGNANSWLSMNETAMRHG